jgi:uncharacterized membrane protein
MQTDFFNFRNFWTAFTSYHWWQVAICITFLGAGVLLLGLGYFIERLRRKFVAQARRSRA